MNSHQNEILQFIYTCNVKNSLFTLNETSQDQRTYQHYINLTGDYHDDDLIDYNTLMKDKNVIDIFNISNIRQRDEFVVHDDNFSLENDRKYFFPKLNKFTEPVGTFLSHEISVETYSEYLKNNILSGPLFLNYNNRNIALVRENITDEIKDDFMLQTDIFKNIISKYPQYRKMLKHIIYPVDVNFNQRTKRVKILNNVHAVSNSSVEIKEYSPIYGDTLKIYSFKKERYLKSNEFKILSKNKYNPDLLDKMGLSVKYLLNKNFIDSFVTNIDLDEHLRVEYETLYSKRYDNLFESNYMSLVSWKDNIFSDREIGYVVDDIQNLLDIMSNTIYKEWLNVVDCDYNAGFLSIFWQEIYYQIFISRLSTIDTTAASDKHIKEKFQLHGLSPDYENFLNEDEIINIYKNIDKFMLNKGQKKVIDNFLGILKRKDQYPIVLNDITYGLIDKELRPRITSDHDIRDSIEIFNDKKKIDTEKLEIFEDNNPNSKRPYMYSVNDLNFGSENKTNVRKLAEDTLLTTIKNNASSEQYNIDIKLENNYLGENIYSKPLDLYLLSKYAFLRFKDDILVRPPVSVSRDRVQAYAGGNQEVQSGKTVYLKGIFSSGIIKSYKWYKVGGTSNSTIEIINSDDARANFVADTLLPGAPSVTHHFRLVVTDVSNVTSADEVIVTIFAPKTSTTPIANAGKDQIVKPNTEVILNANKSIGFDDNNLKYLWTRIGGSGSSNIFLSNIKSINPTFITDDLRIEDKPVTHEFQLTVTGSNGLTSTDTITVTVAPSQNQRPVANAGSDITVNSGEEYTLNGTGSTDPNLNISKYIWTRIGGDGDPNIQITGINTATPTVVFENIPHNNSQTRHQFRLTVVDSLGLSDSDDVEILVNPEELSPIVNAGKDQVIVQNTQVQLTGTVTVGDGNIVSTIWSNLDGIQINNSGSLNASFTSPSLEEDEGSIVRDFILTVTDDNNKVVTDSVSISIIETNTDPVASAGDDIKVGPSATVVLDGRNSYDPDNQDLTYHWEVIRNTGNPIVLQTPRESISEFITEGISSGEIEYEIRLTVQDNSGSSHSDTITITVDGNTVAPSANAGSDETIISGNTVALSATSSTNGDGSITSYEWIRIGGTGRPLIDLTNANTATPTFTADNLNPGDSSVTHEFLLIVTDDNDLIDTDKVIITINAIRVPPIANAGRDQTIQSGEIAILDGRRSRDEDGNIVSYAWSRIGGSGDSSIVLSNENTSQSTFTTDTLTKDQSSVDHRFMLTVTDDENRSNSDTVTITVNPPANIPPQVNAGPDQTVNVGETVYLDGRNSDDSDGSIVSYLWSTGDYSDITLQNRNTIRASFVVPNLIGSEPLLRVFTLTITDDNGAERHDSTTITINPPNITPVANAGPDQIVVSGDIVQLNGSRSYDLNDDTILYNWDSIPSTFISNLRHKTSINPKATPDPTFTAPDVIVPTVYEFQLSIGDSLDTSGNINITSTDNVRITVLPQNQIPVANAGNDRIVNSGTTIELDGTGSTYSSSDIPVYSWRRSGGTGDSNIQILNADTSVATVTVDIIPKNDNILTQEFTLSVINEHGLSDTDTIEIKIIPEGNQYPVSTISYMDGTPDNISVPSGQVNRILSISGSQSVDPDILDDNISLRYSWTIERISGTTELPTIFNNDAENCNVILPETIVSPSQYRLTLTVTDRVGLESQDSITITIVDGSDEISSNTIPVAHAGFDQTVDSGDVVTLDGSRSNDPDNDVLEYSWIRTSGTGDASITLSDQDSINPTFTADTLTAGSDAVNHLFTLTVTDPSGEEHEDIVIITVNSPTPIPTAHAGDDITIKSNQLVILDGSSSINHKGNNENLTYSWDITSGINGNLTDENTVAPSFQAPRLNPSAPSEIFIITLTVRYENGQTDTDTTQITVNAPPTANAGGNQTVTSGDTVVLNGSRSSDSVGHINRYSWERIGGTGSDTITLSPSNTSISPAFIADELEIRDRSVTHIFTLTVTDDVGNTNSDTVTITINAPSIIHPIAEAGPNQENVISGSIVQLDGLRSSDPNRRSIIGYNWIRTGGSGNVNIVLSNYNIPNPTFTADVLEPGDEDVTHIFSLTITVRENNIDITDIDTVTITVKAPENQIPEANAGDDLIADSGDSVTLSGSGTDGDGHIVSYTWLSGNPNIILHNENTRVARFTAPTLLSSDESIILTFELRVVDNLGAIGTDTVNVTINPPDSSGAVPNDDNIPPTANAGNDQTAAQGSTVILDGRESLDIDGLISTYSWISIDPSINIINNNSAVATFIAPTLTAGTISQSYNFQLTVTDDGGKIATDTVTVTVMGISNQPPQANAGNDQTVISGNIVTLDGSGSLDPDMNEYTYLWIRLSGTGDNSISLSDSTVQMPTFTSDTLMAGNAAVTHIFRLTVTDIHGAFSYDDVTITVDPPEPINTAPVANAGNDVTIRQVSSNNAFVIVPLDGSQSQAHGSATLETYRWSLIDVSNDENSLSTFFRIQDGVNGEFLLMGMPTSVNRVTLTFSLLIRDNEGQTDTDTVDITVIRYNEPATISTPEIASILSGSSHTLVPTVSDPDGINSYSWERTGGTGDPNIVIQNANTKNLTVTGEILNPGSSIVTHEFVLTITDSRGDTTQSDIWSVYVRPPQPDGGAVGLSPPIYIPPPPAIIPNDINEKDIVVFNNLETYRYQVGYINPEFNLDKLPEFIDIDGDKKIDAYLNKEEMFDKRSIGELNKIYNNTQSTNGFISRDQFLEYLNISVATYANILDKFKDAKNDNLKLKLFNKLLYTPVDSNDENTSFLIKSEKIEDQSLYTDSIKLDIKILSGEQSTFQEWLNKNKTLNEFIQKVEEKRIKNNDGLDIYLNLYNEILYSLYGDLSYPLFDIDNKGLYKKDVGGVVELLTGYHFTNVERSGSELNKNIIDLNYTFASMDISSNINKKFVIDSEVKITNKTLTSVSTEGDTNIAPIANAGDDRTVSQGSKVVLDGRKSLDKDDKIISYKWIRIGGTSTNTIAIENSKKSIASFIADTLELNDKTVTHEFRLIVTDEKGNVDSDDITITISPSSLYNLLPVADAGPDREVPSESTVYLNGFRSLDLNGKIVSYHWSRTGGTGDPNIVIQNANKLNASFEAERIDSNGSPVTHIFSLMVLDEKDNSSIDKIIITINPELENTPPIVNAGPNQFVKSSSHLADTIVTLNGFSSDEDGDDENLTYRWEQLSGETVTLLNPNEEVTTFVSPRLDYASSSILLVFRLTVMDIDGLSSSDEVIITVNSLPIPNRVPIANAGLDQNGPSDRIIRLDGSASEDPDGNIISYEWSLKTTDPITSHPSPIFIPNRNVVNPSFRSPTLNSGDPSITYTFELKVVDNDNDPNIDTVDITIDAPPYVYLGNDREVNSNDTVTIDAGDYIGYGTPTYRWSRVSGTGDVNLPLLNTNTKTLSFVADALIINGNDVTHTFRLIITDGHGIERSDNIQITIKAPIFNAPPIAHAGDDRDVESNTLITLNAGSSTDPERGQLTYLWQRIGGTLNKNVTLSDSTSQTPTFTSDTLSFGDTSIIHIFKLTVTDQYGKPSINTDTNTVTITVLAPNRLPIARIINTGTNTYLTGTFITLDGSTSSDLDEPSVNLNYLWSRTGGSGNVNIIDNVVKTGSRLSFTADTLVDGANDVNHIFKLTVTDSRGGISEASITVTIESNELVNLEPTAEAGPNQTAKYEEVVYLDGSGSIDPENRPLTYSWSSTSSDITIINPTSSSASFVAPDLQNGNRYETKEYTITLTVRDDGENNQPSTDTLVITVIPPDNVVPIARAGDNRIVNYGETITLDGSMSEDPDGNIKSYRWTHVDGPSGETIILTNPNTIRPSFVAPTHGKGAGNFNYTFRLTVTDYRDDSSADDIIITVNSPPPNQNPIARVGNDREVASSTLITLDASSSSDPDGEDTALRYSWERISGTGNSNIVLNNRTTSQPTFTSDTITPGGTDVTHTFRVTVTDPEGQSATDDIEITVKAPVNLAPIAHAGDDQTAIYNATVELDGRGSTDPENLTLGYQWTVSDEDSSSITLINSGTAQASFVAPNLQSGNNFPSKTYTITLTVTDHKGLESTDTVDITVDPPRNALPISKITNGRSEQLIMVRYM